ncbi:MAG: DUF2510 domain-containing protein [Cellulomonas sp.]
MDTLPAGWYSDPQWPGGRRYFDGAVWTNHDGALAPGNASLVGARPHGGLIAPEPRAGMATGLKVILWVLGVAVGVAFLLLLVGVATGFGQEAAAAGAGSATTRMQLSRQRAPT